MEEWDNYYKYTKDGKDLFVVAKDGDGWYARLHSANRQRLINGYSDIGPFDTLELAQAMAVLL